jgi:hypothetical protein
MNKNHLLHLVFIFFCLSLTHCIFNNIPKNNFTTSGYNNTQPFLVLDGTGTKFLIWTRYPAHYQIHSIDGKLKCEMNSTRILNDIIWPANHAPIIFGANGLFFLVDENNCHLTFAYDLYDITKVFG